MSGWLSACRKHQNKMIKDIEESEFFFNGMCPTEEKLKCDYPDCSGVGIFEIYWGDECLAKRAEEAKVNIGSLMDANWNWEGDI